MQGISGTRVDGANSFEPLECRAPQRKPRLVLDLTYVNSFIDTSGLKFKYEQLS